MAQRKRSECYTDCLARMHRSGKGEWTGGQSRLLTDRSYKSKDEQNSSLRSRGRASGQKDQCVQNL